MSVPSVCAEWAYRSHNGSQAVGKTDTNQETLKCMASQYLERFLTAVNGRAGEEVLAVAHKSA